MDILLTWRGKHTLETKVNRTDIRKTVDRAIDQVCTKYLLTEKADEGYAVIFDIKAMPGELLVPERRRVGDKEALGFRIGIGRNQSET